MRLMPRDGYETLTPSVPAVSNCYCMKGSAPYWSNPPVLILTLGHSGAREWATECPNVKNQNWWGRPVCQSVKP